MSANNLVQTEKDLQQIVDSITYLPGKAKNLYMMLFEIC